MEPTPLSEVTATRPILSFSFTFPLRPSPNPNKYPAQPWLIPSSACLLQFLSLKPENPFLPIKMATNLLPFCPSVVRASAISNPKSDNARRRSSSAANWWSPLFGWSPEPDYIDADGRADSPEKSDGGSEMKPSRSSRFAPGCFTEEKAKRLRLLTKETSSFHDVMYHSAIASRLASDFKNGSDL